MKKIIPFIMIIASLFISSCSIGDGTLGEFNPGEIDSCILWLDAGKDVYVNVGIAEQWTDQSKHKRLFTYTGSPNYYENYYNSRPTIYFFNSYFSSPSFVDSNSGECTIIIAIEPTGDGTIFCNSPDGASDYTFFRTNGVNMDVGPMSASIISVVDYEFQIMSIRSKGLTSRYYKNGSYINENVGFGNSTSFYNNMTYIGNLVSGGSFFTGYISEIVLFDRALSNDEREAVEDYLMAKYGL